MRTVRTEERLLWWDESEEDGDVVLCWNERGQRLRVAGQAMSVTAMTEVAVGKERPVFGGAEVEHHCAEHCVSMLCGEAGDQVIHVIAEREDSRASFVSALRTSLVHFQSKLPLATPTPAPSTPSLPLSPLSATSPQALLSSGSTFVSFTRSSPSPSLLTLAPTFTSAVVFVHWDREQSPSKYGQFWVSPPGKRERIAAYGAFSEILSGKRSAELQSPAAAAASADCCLSLVGAKGALHLQAGSEVQRNVWIEAIKCLYSQFSNKNKDASSSPHSPFTSPSLSTPDTALAAKLPLLVQGVTCIHHMHAKVGGGVKAASIPPQRIFMSYEPTASTKGRLRWMLDDEHSARGARATGRLPGRGRHHRAEGGQRGLPQAPRRKAAWRGRRPTASAACPCGAPRAAWTSSSPRRSSAGPSCTPCTPSW